MIKLQPVRFGQDKGPFAEQAITQGKTAALLSHNRIVETRQEIATRKKKKFKSAVGYLLFSLGLMGAAGAMGGYGVTGVQQYRDSQGVVSHWKGLVDWAKEAQAEKTTYNYDIQTMQAFQNEVKNYLRHFAEELAESKDPAAQQLAERITFDAVVAEHTIDNVGLELFQYIDQQRAQNSALNIQDFFDKSPVISNLAVKEKEHLANYVYQLVNNNPDMKVENFSLKAVLENRNYTQQAPSSRKPSPERLLREVLEIYSGNQVHGLNIDTFASMNTKEKALEFFDKMVASPNVLAHLSSAERQAFLEFGQQQINRYDYDNMGLQRSWGYGFLVYALSVLGIGLLSGGMIGLAKDAKRGIATLTRKKDPLKLLQLKIIESDKTVSSKIIQDLDARCRELATLREAGLEIFPELKLVVEASLSAYNASASRYSGAKRTDLHAEMLRAVFEGLVHQDLMAENKTAIKAEKYYQQALDFANVALESQEFFPELSYLKNPGEGNKLQKIENKSKDEEKIWSEINAINKELPHARRIYLNQLVVVVRSKKELDVQKSELVRLQNDLESGGATPSLLRKIEQTEGHRDTKKILYDKAIERKQEAQAAVNSYEDQLMTCQMLIIDQRDHHAFQAAMKELGKLNAFKQRASENPTVDEMKREADLHRHIRQVVVGGEKAREQAQQLIREHLDKSVK